MDKTEIYASKECDIDISSVTSSGVVKLLPLFRYDCSRKQACFPDLRKVFIDEGIFSNEPSGLGLS